MWFLDRDLNAAANILLVGKSLLARPDALRWGRTLEKRTREEYKEDMVTASKKKPAVGAAGPSSDPFSGRYRLAELKQSAVKGLMEKAP